MKTLSSKETAKIQKLRAQFPSEIMVRARRSEDGGFVADVLAFPGCITEGDTFSELIEMINDAVRTYFDVPQKYASYMPSYFPPIKTAQQLDAFPPVRKAESKVTLTLTERAGAEC
jgi:predicted RNase H-like HicB family nuclease